MIWPGSLIIGPSHHWGLGTRLGRELGRDLDATLARFGRLRRKADIDPHQRRNALSAFEVFAKNASRERVFFSSPSPGGRGSRAQRAGWGDEDSKSESSPPPAAQRAVTSPLQGEVNIWCGSAGPASFEAPPDQVGGRALRMRKQERAAGTDFCGRHCPNSIRQSMREGRLERFVADLRLPNLSMDHRVKFTAGPDPVARW